MFGTTLPCRLLSGHTPLRVRIDLQRVVKVIAFLRSKACFQFAQLGFKTIDFQTQFEKRGSFSRSLSFLLFGIVGISAHFLPPGIFCFPFSALVISHLASRAFRVSHGPIFQSPLEPGDFFAAQCFQRLKATEGTATYHCYARA
jgi:hypothetical protein